jgi:monoamine oxidase
MENSPGMKNTDVIVAGAGMAGLAAARQLAEAGLSVILLEARNRIGGRILTVRSPHAKLPIELGAEFVHGQPPELLDLIHEAGATIFEREGSDLCHDGNNLAGCNFGDAFDVLDDLPAEPDMSFTEFLAQKRLPEAVEARAKRYVEGFNAADANLIGTASLRKQQQAEEEIDGGRSFRVLEGYDRLPEFLLGRFLAAGGQLHRNTAVTAIDWRPGQVRVTTASLEVPELRAQRAVIALPLGVLHAKSLAISPDTEASPAIRKMAMGAATRITLLFRERFWEPRAPGLSFLLTQERPLPTWWTSFPNESPALTGWMGGPRALAAPSGGALQKEALAALSRVFERNDLGSLLVSAHTHDWQSDPFSCGAYSYAPKGALLASAELARPVEDTLYFAGEHTDTTGHWGTVHAALRSGLRAARQILESRT